MLVLVALCLVILVADLRFRYLEVVRQAISVVTHPLQVIAAAPADFVRNGAVYFATLVEVQLENAELRRSQVQTAHRLLRFDHLERENDELRRLLAMAHVVSVRSVAAEILYDAPDPFARKVILDKGARHGVSSGLAVVDARGMIGQVTRVYPIQAEVTLITDKEQSVPVQVERNGLRGVLVGSGHGRLDLRYISSEADILPGDRLVTSGLDGIFLPGLPVADVISVEQREGAFRRVRADPIASVERAIQVLVLGRETPPAARPDPSAEILDGDDEIKAD